VTREIGCGGWRRMSGKGSWRIALVSTPELKRRKRKPPGERSQNSYQDLANKDGLKGDERYQEELYRWFFQKNRAKRWFSCDGFWVSGVPYPPDAQVFFADGPYQYHEVNGEGYYPISIASKKTGVPMGKLRRIVSWVPDLDRVWYVHDQKWHKTRKHVICISENDYPRIMEDIDNLVQVAKEQRTWNGRAAKKAKLHRVS
jgi:hypothetical protein